MKLSHTQLTTFLDCSEKWRLYYQEKLRSKYLGSPLFFGKALDEAFNRLLLEKKKELTDEEKEMMEYPAQYFFMKNMNETRHNGKNILLGGYEYCTYSKKDLDYSVLSDTCYQAIELYAEVLNFEDFKSYMVETFIDEFRSAKQPTKEEKQLHNYICWLSLCEKGKLLLKAYETDVMPQIEEVVSIQEGVSIISGDDEIVGFIDAKIRFKDVPDITYVVDNKTSSKAYKDDSVVESDQLALYSEYAENRNCCFIVVEKNLRKKQPRHRIQIIKDTISDEKIDEVLDKFSEVYYSIQERNFEKKKSSKECFFYGKPCDYYNYCHNNTMVDLVDMKEKKKDE